MVPGSFTCQFVAGAAKTAVATLSTFSQSFPERASRRFGALQSAFANHRGPFAAG